MKRPPILRLLCLTAGLLVTRTAEAGLQYVGQSRSVEASAPDFGLSGRQARAAADVGPFDARVAVDRVNPYLDRSAAAASQHSVLAAEGVTASGNVSAVSGDYGAFGRSSLAVTFDLDAAEPYRFDFAGDIAYDGFYSSSDVLTLQLRRTDAGHEAKLVDRRASDVELVDDPALGSLSAAGTLAPGRYELVFDLEKTVATGVLDASYRLDFAVGGGGPPPTAVPLPPAGYAGLLTLGGLAGGRWWAARRRRVSVR